VGRPGTFLEVCSPFMLQGRHWPGTWSVLRKHREEGWEAASQGAGALWEGSRHVASPSSADVDSPPQPGCVILGVTTGSPAFLPGLALKVGKAVPKEV
jgi:hypothetical protein